AGAVPTDLATLVAENAPGTTVEATAEATSEPEATIEATSEPEATVEATEESSSTPTLLRNNGYGYLFLVGGNGRFAILRSSGRSLTPLVDWRDSDKIAKGAARNHIRAVCVNDYLALYVNDAFLADAIDDRYPSGQVGLAAAGATRLGITVNFDNLTVSEGRAG
ncbi:MAG: hypothetical protein K8I60_06535, partial [Anaerolineae bacterium]|nr:hypothetical protein [Anaerolineae bacterium]